MNPETDFKMCFNCILMTCNCCSSESMIPGLRLERQHDQSERQACQEVKARLYTTQR